MNKMPEVAKMLGVELEEEFKVTSIVGEMSSTFSLSEHGLHSVETTTPFEDLLVMLIKGDARILKLPRYTIPEDLPVDAKVWVRHSEKHVWEARHFCEFNKKEEYKEERPYRCWSNGNTSFSSHGILVATMAWKYCITDEEYQKRQGADNE